MSQSIYGKQVKPKEIPLKYRMNKKRPASKPAGIPNPLNEKKEDAKAEAPLEELARLAIAEDQKGEDDREYVDCPCGSHILSTSMYSHKKSKHHLEYMASNLEEKSNDENLPHVKSIE